MDGIGRAARAELSRRLVYEVHVKVDIRAPDHSLIIHLRSIVTYTLGQQVTGAI